MYPSFTYVLLLLTLIAVTAMFARWLGDRCKQPSVLGELLLGVLIGNVGYYFGHPLFVFIMHYEGVEALLSGAWAIVHDSEPAAKSLNHMPEVLVEAISHPLASDCAIAVTVLAAFAHLGVLVLLFSAGLESDVRRMTRLWRPASSVAFVGISVPVALGYIVCTLLHPTMATSGHLFIAATLAATSVGITARVFEEMKQLDSQEADVIFGAAVIDDIIALVLLAVVVGIASTGAIDMLSISSTVLTAGVFIGLVLTLGEHAAAKGSEIAEKLDQQNSRVLFPLGLMLAMAWLASAVQLAPIVGAFTAGLIIKERSLQLDTRVASVAQQISPLERFLAPVFFLFIGMQVNVEYFFNIKTLLLALAFTIAAVIGKMVAGLAAGRNLDRLTIGVGMIPRGEVGLIFINVGRGLGIVSNSLFSALVVAVITTTLITPPALKWSLSRAVSESNSKTTL